MVAEPWIHKMRTALSFQNSSSSIVAGPRKKKEGWKPSQDGDDTVGILCFEVANAMSRAINLYRSLSDFEIVRLRSQTLASLAVGLSVSTNEPYLLGLALAKKLDDLLAGRIDPAGLGSLSKDMDSIVRKMERFVSSTATLYIELEVLTQLEQSAKKHPRHRQDPPPRAICRPPSGDLHPPSCPTPVEGEEAACRYQARLRSEIHAKIIEKVSSDASSPASLSSPETLRPSPPPGVPPPSHCLPCSGTGKKKE